MVMQALFMKCQKQLKSMFIDGETHLSLSFFKIKYLDHKDVHYLLRFSALVSKRFKRDINVRIQVHFLQFII